MVVSDRRCLRKVHDQQHKFRIRAFVFNFSRWNSVSRVRSRSQRRVNERFLTPDTHLDVGHIERFNVLQAYPIAPHFKEAVLDGFASSRGIDKRLLSWCDLCRRITI